MSKELLFAGIYFVMFILTWGATYAYFTNNSPTLDSPLERRENLAFALLFSISGPIGFLLSFFCSGFYYYGLQWWGGPKEGRKKCSGDELKTGF